MKAWRKDIPLRYPFRPAQLASMVTPTRLVGLEDQNLVCLSVCWPTHSVRLPGFLSACSIVSRRGLNAPHLSHRTDARSATNVLQPSCFGSDFPQRTHHVDTHIVHAHKRQNQPNTGDLLAPIKSQPSQDVSPLDHPSRHAAVHLAKFRAPRIPHRVALPTSPHFLGLTFTKTDE